MIATLTKLGEQLSDDLNEWAGVIDIPKIDSKKENLVVKIIFDLDEQNISAEIAGEYQEKSPFIHKFISIKGGNNKATYTCSTLEKIIQIEKTFFGKVDNKGKQPIQGEFKEYIDNNFPALKVSQLYKLLTPIFQLRTKFIDEDWNDADAINKKLLGEDYKKTGNKQKVVLIYVCIVSKEFELEQATPMSEIEGFNDFIHLDRFTKPTTQDEKVSYATGLKKQNVIGVQFPNRYSLNYMFVETTLNYASQFDKNQFAKNYQINTEEQLYLERASEHLLKTQQVSIANISHCIIPQFLNKSKVNLKGVLKGVFKKSELLFQSNQYQDLVTDIDDQFQEEETYWINFLAFESDGNSFKTINLIEDVSKTHLEKVLATFATIDIRFKQLEVVDWRDVMSDFNDKKEKAVYRFNLNTIYRIIPQRKDKEKKNEALSVFKSILERRKLDKQVLFKHFVDLILCHRFKRYEAYKNVKRFGEDFFDFAIRDAVFKYLAFFEVLKQLNLINNMENNEILDNNDLAKLDSEEANQLETFFTANNLKASSKALFYLGQALSNIAYAQVLKDHSSKPILNKVNYNGMNREDVLKLHAELSEKITQYVEIVKNGKTYYIQKWTEPILRLFRENYAVPVSDKNPKLSNYENVFYLLLGYSFRNKVKETK